MILGWESERFSKRLVPTSHLSTPSGEPVCEAPILKILNLKI